jgi:hypothetical protein
MNINTWLYDKAVKSFHAYRWLEMSRYQCRLSRFDQNAVKRRRLNRLFCFHKLSRTDRYYARRLSRKGYPHFLGRDIIELNAYTQLLPNLVFLITAHCLAT